MPRGVDRVGRIRFTGVGHPPRRHALYECSSSLWFVEFSQDAHASCC